MVVIAVYWFLINGVWLADPAMHPPTPAKDMRSCEIGKALAEGMNESIQRRIANGDTPTYKSIPIEGVRIQCLEQPPKNP
jgi:hypothetical protein